VDAYFEFSWGGSYRKAARMVAELRGFILGSQD